MSQPAAAVGEDLVSQETADARYLDVCARFASDPRVRIIRDFTIPAATRFPDKVFDWIYVDANHLQCYDDMTAWWPKVKSGGYLTGHDYAKERNWMTVTQDVDRFVKEHQLVMTATTEKYASWVIQKP